MSCVRDGCVAVERNLRREIVVEYLEVLVRHGAWTHVLVEADCVGVQVVYRAVAGHLRGRDYGRRSRTGRKINFSQFVHRSGLHNNPSGKLAFISKLYGPKKYNILTELLYCSFSL